MDRLRLNEFVSMIGEARETFRSLVHRGDAPIAKARTGEGQRTYDGADLLAWCLFTMLRRAQINTRLAGETVRLTGVVDGFFAAMEKGEDVSDWHLIAYTVRRDRGGDAGAIEIVRHTYGNEDDVADILKEERKEYGQPNLEGWTRLGMVSLTTVPLWPCYERCQTTAEAHGFKMRGPDLFEIDGQSGK